MPVAANQGNKVWLICWYMLGSTRFSCSLGLFKIENKSFSFGLGRVCNSGASVYVCSRSAGAYL